MLRNPKVHNRTHKCPPPVPILGSHGYQVHATTSCFLKIHFYIIHLCIGFPSGLFLSVLPTTTLYAPHLYPVCATYSANFILFDLIIRTLFGEEYRSLSSSLSCFLRSPDTSPHLGSNTFLSTLFSNNLSLCSSLNIRDQVSHSYKKIRKHSSSAYLDIYILDSKLESKQFLTE